MEVEEEGFGGWLEEVVEEEVEEVEVEVEGSIVRRGMRVVEERRVVVGVGVRVEVEDGRG